MPLYLEFYFWLLLISASLFVLERLFPWRPHQEAIREGLVQDLFWMVLNMQYISWMLAIATVRIASLFNATFLHFGARSPDSLRLIASWPAWLQFVVFFLIKDFLEWNIHRWLHLVPWLWKLHKLHHSVEELDWAATFRSHWGEIIIYKTVVYLPLVVLGVGDKVIFAILTVSLLIQELCHANLKWDWGPFRLFVNSPRFHAWHHIVELHGKGGQNFAVTLPVWDWLFGTAYWPKEKETPVNFGFDGMNSYPKGIWRRLWDPFVPERRKPPGVGPEHRDFKA